MVRDNNKNYKLEKIKKGVKWLENRLDDGEKWYFSQLFQIIIGTGKLISIVELWNQKFNSDVYSKFCQKLLKYILVESFIDINTGKVPNLGANDGHNFKFTYL